MAQPLPLVTYIPLAGAAPLSEFECAHTVRL
jgi:hypothetical protein